MTYEEAGNLSREEWVSVLEKSPFVPKECDHEYIWTSVGAKRGGIYCYCLKCKKKTIST